MIKYNPLIFLLYTWLQPEKSSYPISPELFLFKKNLQISHLCTKLTLISETNIFESLNELGVEDFSSVHKCIPKQKEVALLTRIS